ncbi:AP2/ERF family transcription factor [Staphylococcus xylosus]|uniref:AP2 domain-containing protein n=1 Tax=Staphylococcus xylosus TaxID=1288 RepID=UPI002DB90D5F|nr:AP2 domain-containing protein [Staphylococcus xylosus]MEB6244675.1 AP2 domain-containing protein [Staphylococcus xylosus]MEB7766090.1 AP2 domain-containing protein [Staphylococcus xylosus]
MDIVGMQFNYLKVLEFHSRNKHKKKLYKCLCTRCGTKKVMIGTAVKNGYSKSCGCLVKDSHTKKHGMTGTLIYKKWKDMKKRCYNTKSQNYKYYGARGIKVCEEWKNNFTQFYNDVGDIPFEGAELDRIDNNDDYKPSNCRWVEHQINSNNRRKYYNKTGYTGVTFKPRLNKFQAQLYKDKKFIYLGLYETAEKAYEAYLKAKNEY